jgi:hypothetical protein
MGEHSSAYGLGEWISRKNKNQPIGWFLRVPIGQWALLGEAQDEIDQLFDIGIGDAG